MNSKPQTVFQRNRHHTRRLSRSERTADVRSSEHVKKLIHIRVLPRLHFKRGEERTGCNRSIANETCKSVAIGGPFGS